MKHLASSKPTRVRSVFIAGKLTARRQPRPCHDGSHVGPLVNTAVYHRFGGIWSGFGECAACSSTIHKSQLRPRAA